MGRSTTYNGVVVCTEWHNYQNFAEWYCTHYPNDGKIYELDKDNKSGDCKIYSPETCCFVDHIDNTLESKGLLGVVYSVKSPDGVIHTFDCTITKFAKDNNLSSNLLGMVIRGKRKHHMGWTSISKKRKNKRCNFMGHGNMSPH